MKHPEAFKNKNFYQLVNLVRQQQQIIKDMLTWDMSNHLQDVIASQMTQLTFLLSVLVSGANEVSLKNSENIYTLEGLSNGKPKVSKIPSGKLPIVSEAPVQVQVASIAKSCGRELQSQKVTLSYPRVC